MVPSLSARQYQGWSFFGRLMKEHTYVENSSFQAWYSNFGPRCLSILFAEFDMCSGITVFTCIDLPRDGPVRQISRNTSVAFTCGMRVACLLSPCHPLWTREVIALSTVSHLHHEQQPLVPLACDGVNASSVARSSNLGQTGSPTNTRASSGRGANV